MDTQVLRAKRNLVLSDTSSHCPCVHQEQGRTGEPQGLLVRHLHPVQRVRGSGQRGEAERHGQRELGRRSELQQQTAHHGVVPQTRPQADHHGGEIHAAAEEPGL